MLDSDQGRAMLDSYRGRATQLSLLYRHLGTHPLWIVFNLSYQATLTIVIQVHRT